MWILTMLLVISILACIGFITLFERKLLSLAQLRLGPNKVMILGIIQPILDGLKLFKKNDLLYMMNFYTLFKIMSLVMFFFSLLLLSCFPYNIFQNKSLMIMFLLMVLGIMSFCILLMGWSSMNKYGGLGSTRSLAQTLSFEINLTILIFLPFMLKNKFNFHLNENYFMMILSYYYLMFFLIMLLEIQRAPLDLGEGESELVSGYNTEYGSLYFTFVFLSEYMILWFFILLMGLLTILNLILIFTFLVMIIRCCYPRLRYDILMKMSWINIMPVNILMWIFMFPLKII